MWWGSTPKGNPNQKKLKTTKKFHQLLQIFDTALHLFFGPLPLNTITVGLVDPHQRPPTRLQFLDHLDNEVHSILHIRSPACFLGASLLKLHAQPLIAFGSFATGSGSNSSPMNSCKVQTLTPSIPTRSPSQRDVRPKGDRGYPPLVTSRQST